MRVLGAHRVASSTARAVSASALLAALACGAPSVFAQGTPRAQRTPVELAPMRVVASTAVIEVSVPMVIEAAPEPADSSTRDPRRESDGRAVENPFGSEPSSSEPTLAQADDEVALTVRRERTPGASGRRCSSGARSYFDERSQLFRPCVANEPAQSTPARPTIAPRTATSAACRPGQRAYFDAREQLFRPCPEPISVGTEEARPRVEPRAPGARRCSPGVRVFYDERERLYRPCP